MAAPLILPSVAVFSWVSVKQRKKKSRKGEEAFQRKRGRRKRKEASPLNLQNSLRKKPTEVKLSMMFESGTCAARHKIHHERVR